MYKNRFVSFIVQRFLDIKKGYAINIYITICSKKNVLNQYTLGFTNFITPTLINTSYNSEKKFLMPSSFVTSCSIIKRIREKVVKEKIINFLMKAVLWYKDELYRLYLSLTC